MLTVAKASHNRLQLQVDGDPLKSVTSPFNDAKHFKAAAKTTGLPVEYLAECVKQFRENETDSFALPVVGGFFVTVRGRNERVGEQFPGSPAEAFAAALLHNSSAANPIITWDDLDEIAALDVDWHGCEPPADAAKLLADLKPVPAYSWLTHGGGLRAIYFRTTAHTAGEYAAAAALYLRKQNSSHRAELLTVTRHPSSSRNGQRCGEVVKRTQDIECRSLLYWFGERTADDEDVKEWLAARNLEVGRRYPHTACPINPSDRGKNDPVQVNEDGVYCHYCKSNGAGFASFAQLVGGGKLGRLASCVRNFVHWTHAALVLSEQIDQPMSVLQAAYRAALRLTHGAADPRCDRVFTTDAKTLVRYAGYWGNVNGEAAKSDGISGLLATLPACQDAEGRPLAAKVDLFSQPWSLESSGYIAVQPVFGVLVPIQDLQGVVRILTPCGDLVSEENARLRPRYLSEAERMPEEQAWRQLEDVLPELPRDYLKLLIAAKLAIDNGSPMPPVIFAHGPSGASKTGSVQVAASILGDRVSEVVYTADEQRLRAGVAAGKRVGSYVVFNEIVKGIDDAKKGSVQGMNPLLGLTASSSSHMLYVGHVELGRVPVLVYTDTKLPAELRWDRQIARRVVEVPLTGALEWTRAMRSHGISHLSQLRTSLPTLCPALDSILSHVADQYGDELFFDAANQLGFHRLDQLMDEERDIIKTFFDAVCNHPAPDEGTLKRIGGPGWKVIRRDDDTPLAVLWSQVCNEEKWHESRRLQSADLKRAIGAVCTFETKQIPNGVAVRFARRITQRQVITNGEVLTYAAVQLDAGQSAVDRLGNAVGGEPAGRGR